MSGLEEQLRQAIDERARVLLLRRLFNDEQGADFLSNDYLGFSRLLKTDDSRTPGRQGSRLLGGNTAAIETLEHEIAGFHGFESALYYNSGYTANLGLFSCLLTRHDTCIYDAFIHASVRDGIRLSAARSYAFAHNSMADLEQKLRQAGGKTVVVVEAVYSMDGDSAPLVETAGLCQKYGASLVVDEAHSIGLYGRNGRGLVHALGLVDQVFAVVYTYGKAMGCHGGAVAGSRVLREYLVNFSRPFIYTTAPPAQQVEAVAQAYRLLQSTLHESQLDLLRHNIGLFTLAMGGAFPGTDVHASHINKFTVGDVNKTIALAAKLREQGYICRPVLSPTVEKGQERIRINLHAFNTAEEITGLIKAYKTLAG